jgi:hypothetical protein
MQREKEKNVQENSFYVKWLKQLVNKVRCLIKILIHESNLQLTEHILNISGFKCQRLSQKYRHWFPDQKLIVR